MGKRLFGWVHNGTDYKVCMLPLGGYVKMTGETEMEMIQTSPTETETLAQAHGDRGNFNTKPRWQRMLIAFAGPVANFILAIVIFTMVAHFHHETVEYLQDRGELDYIAANSPRRRRVSRWATPSRDSTRSRTPPGRISWSWVA